MPSALTPNGTTAAWKKLRANWTERIRQAGSIPCRLCGLPITTTTAWDLGHPDHGPRVLGGGDIDLWPEHALKADCPAGGNRSNGAKLGNKLQAGKPYQAWTPDLGHQTTDHATRTVVVLFGPPGAGKSTTAHANTAGLKVYDRDDGTWPSERAFDRALHRIALDPVARAVVIRTGATRTARARTLHQVRATHAWLLLVDQALCLARIGQRHRGDGRRMGPAVADWFTRHRNDRGGAAVDVPPWPGTWPDLAAPGQSPASGPASRVW